MCLTSSRKLNIGGTKYLTTTDTLCSGENFFSGLLSGRIPSLMDEDGYYFIDRDGKLFCLILDYLRTGKWKLPPGVDNEDVLEEAKFYSINLHHFSPLSDAALCNWLEEKATHSTIRQWTRFRELEEIKESILKAFRTEQEQGSGYFQFVFYPEIEAEGGSISKFLAKLIGEDDVSPEHRKVIESCKTQLLKCNFAQHPYYPLPLAAWKTLGLPQCQTLLSQKIFSESKLSVDFKMSRIGVARVEKKQELEGATLYRIHDFYALNGLDPPLSLSTNWQAEQPHGQGMRQQFDRCISAILCFWSYRFNHRYAPEQSKSPKISRFHEDLQMLSGSPPL